MALVAFGAWGDHLVVISVQQTIGLCSVGLVLLCSRFSCVVSVVVRAVHWGCVAHLGSRACLLRASVWIFDASRTCDWDPNPRLMDRPHEIILEK